MLKIVFANTTATVSIGPGNHRTVHQGEHWLASDPIVRAHPDLFTEDARYGLCSTAPLPEDTDEPEPTVEELTAAAESAQKKLAEAKARSEADAQEQEKEQADASQPAAQAPVEQATKAPGEKRTTRRG